MRALLTCVLLAIACGASPAPSAPPATTAAPLVTVERRPSIDRPATCAAHPAAQVLATEPDTHGLAAAPDLSSLVYERGPDVVLHHLASGTRTTVRGAFVGFTSTNHALFRIAENGADSLYDLDPELGKPELLGAGIAGVKLVDDGRTAVFWGATENTWVFFPALHRRVFASRRVPPPGRPVPIPVDGGLLFPDPDTGGLLVFEATNARGNAQRIVWVDAAANGWVLDRGRAPYRLGRWPAGTEIPIAPDDAPLMVVDGAGDAWWWDPGAHVAQVVAQGIRRAVLAEDGRTAVLVATAGALFRLDVATGEKRVLAYSQRVLEPIVAPDGTHAAVVEHPAELDADRTARVRLFDLVAGAEIPLPTVHGAPDCQLCAGTTAAFHKDGTLLYVAEGTERILDASTGRELFETDRADLRDEGHTSFWGADDAGFYTYPGGRNRAFTPVYRWDAASETETLVGDSVSVRCEWPGRDFLLEGPEDGPHAALTWEHATGRRWAIAEDAAWFGCTEAGALVTAGGALRFADPRTQAVRVVVEHPEAVVRVGTQLVFSDAESVCAVPVGKL